MITIDEVEYTEEELSEDGKVRVQHILSQRARRIQIILELQDIDQSIAFHAKQIKNEMEPEVEE
jgi:hypothetical protein